MGFFGWLFTLFVPFSTLTFGLFQSLTLERHFFRRLFLAFLAYFAIGAWNNYNQFGATGWDALPHRDVWRDLPHVVVDIFKGRFPLSFSVLLHSNLRDFCYRRSRRESRWLLVYIISSSLAGMSTRFLRSSGFRSEKRVRFLRRSFRFQSDSCWRFYSTMRPSSALKICPLWAATYEPCQLKRRKEKEDR
jgi:hypothetical protein